MNRKSEQPCYYADHIIKACNYFEALLEAAKLVEQFMPVCHARKSLRKIIAQCEKEAKK